MTALLAVESNRLDETLIVSDCILKSYGSGIYIQVGEELTLRDLLYGLMLRSGNDAAVMIANFVSNNEKEFVDKMNSKAREIGMKNTTFNNPSGLDNNGKGNYSTAYDMAVLTSYVMKYNTYKEIVKTKKYILKTNFKTYIWYNKNKLLGQSYITGGKTGFTEIAKRTLVSTASYNNMNFVVVTLNDGDDFNRHQKLYEEVFNLYKSYHVLEKDNYGVVDTHYNKNLYIENDRYLTLKEDEVNKLYSKIKLKTLKKYKNKDIVGVNEIYLNNNLLLTENIKVEVKEEKKGSWWNRLKEWLHL